MTDDNTQKGATSQKILQYQDHQVADETQTMLNQPVKSDQALSQADQAFLQMVTAKIQSKEIDLYRPATLLNQAVYGKLAELDRGKADVSAVNLLSAIREIYKLTQLGYVDTYQIENMVHRVRVTKERLEEVGGDIFII